MSCLSYSMDQLERKERANGIEIANICLIYFDYMHAEKQIPIDPVIADHVKKLGQSRLTDSEKKEALGVFDSLFAADFRFLEYNAERTKKSEIR